MRRFRRFLQRYRRLLIGLTGLVLLVVTVRSARFHRFLHDPMARPITTVEGSTITEGDLTTALQERYRDEMLPELMLQRKVEHEAEVNHVTVDPARFQAGHARICKQYLDGGRIAWQDSELRTQLLIEGLILKSIPEEAKHQFYDQFKDDLLSVDLYHILVREDKDAEQVNKELKRGSDFAVVARQFSQDQLSNADGGHVGILTYGQLKRMFGVEVADQIRDLPVGVLSPPIHTSFGYHIIKVATRRVTYDELKSTVEDQLSEAQQMAYVQKLQYSLVGKKVTTGATGLPTAKVFAPVGHSGSGQPGVFAAPSGSAAPNVFADPTGKPSGSVFSAPLGRPCGPQVFSAPSGSPSTNVFGVPGLPHTPK